MNRTIDRIHKAEYRPIADLITYSPLPTRQLQQVNPFLFLNHHGYQVYPQHNNGLPFGPHPHRGMETVTFIIEGDIMHKDSQGYQSIIRSGGIQWMTAGRGLIHAEVSSEQFKKEGGPLEILQLWVNLPARLKMAAPSYHGFQKEEIPVANLGEGVQMQLISGEFQGQQGAYQSLTGVFMSTITLQKGSNVQLEVSESRSIFFYVVRGNLSVNNQSVQFRQLVTFSPEGTTLGLSAEEDSLVLFGHADPIQEPVVAQGPFVMNTEAEIEQAYLDYRQGKFGDWKG